jgi:hypothetical protein
VRVNKPKEPAATYSPPQWEHPEVQELFGQVLVKTGQKYKDPDLIRLGQLHQQAARKPNSNG